MKEALKFNDLDTYYKTDRRSFTGKYEVIQGVPRLGHVPFSLLGSLNPLSPNSDQHQFPPNNIHTMSRDKAMRINKMIT